jgi:hypothetical protein
MSVPPPHAHRPQHPGEAPASIRTSITLVWVIVALSVLNAALSFVYLDELVDAATQGQNVNQSTATTGVIVGAVFSVLVFGGLWVLLAVFLRRAANWARIVLTVFAALGVVFGAIGLFASDEPLFVTATNLVTVVLQAALLYFMWRPDSSAYLQARPAP